MLRGSQFETVHTLSAAAAAAMCWLWALFILRAAADEMSAAATTGLQTQPGNGIRSFSTSEATVAAITSPTQLDVSDAVLPPDERSTESNWELPLAPVDEAYDAGAHSMSPTSNESNIGRDDYASSRPLRPIRICYMASDKTPKFVKQKQGRIASGAMSYAVERVNADPGLLRKYGLRLEFVYIDDRADSKHAIAKMSEQWRVTDVVAFFGPENTCDVEGRLAAAWNLPIFAYVSITIVLQSSYRDPRATTGSGPYRPMCGCQFGV